jgi:hypothetical protein
MRTCPTCGAHVVDDLEWCNQCYSALPAVQAPAATAVLETPAAADRPLWVRSNMGQPEVKIAPEFSRWRGGATSFGPVGRVLLTLGVIVMLIVGYPLLRGLIYAVGGMDIPGVGLIVLYACVALPGGAYMLNRVWKPERIK